MPSPHVCMGATLKCMFALPPGTSKLIVLPLNRTMTSNKPAANIMDHIPIVNIPPFGMCQSPTNPLFIAATAAAMGTPTPVPCIPVTVAPWSPGSPTVKLGPAPALNMTSMLTCAMGTPMCISIIDAGQTKEMVA
jgi:Domain of unknown function (DUF4280)